MKNKKTENKIVTKKGNIKTEKMKNTIITNPETIEAMHESKLQLKHPENGVTTIEEFWSDLL